MAAVGLVLLSYRGVADYLLVFAMLVVSSKCDGDGH